MAFLDSIFNGNKTVTVTLQTLTQTISGGVMGAESWSDTASYTGIFYRGSMAMTLVNERYRQQIDGVVILRPSDFTTLPGVNNRFKIDSVYYSIIYPDDIAEQDKVLMIPVKKYV